MGWTVVLNPDDATTAWNRDKTKILHSHSPQPSPGNPGDRRAVIAGLRCMPTGRS